MGFFYGGFENSTIETYVDFPFQFGLDYSNLVPNAPVTFPNGSIATLETGISGYRSRRLQWTPEASRLRAKITI